MKSIVCGVSFDSDLEGIAGLSADFGRALNLEVKLVHASIDPSGKLKSQWGWKLASWVRQRGSDASYLQVEEGANKALLLLDSDPDTELLVVGASSASPRRRGFLGGTAMRLLHHSTKPLLIVPAGGRTPWQGAARRILYPTDFSQLSYAGASWLRRLAGPMEAETHLLHVVKDRRELGV